MVNERLFGLPQASITSDDHYTPRWVFETLELQFDLDVSAPPGGIPWIPAKNYYTQADDGLASPWIGKVWMNPPYSRVSQWIDRFVDHGDGIGLISLFKSKWLEKAWTTVDGIVPLPSSIKFDRPDSLPAKSINFPSFLIAMGSKNVKALNRFGRVR